MALAFAHQHSPQHQSPLLAHHHTNHMAGGGGGGGGGVNLQDWLKAWKAWAGTRKRGKMAQFIVQKLEENTQARWLDITVGKFELTEWHGIADEWFKEKPRSSDQVDAPCMLRKGLPRAFPGLDEVKTESIKEGTQYRSRVFKATPNLVQEVQLYVNKPGGGYPNGNLSPYYGPQTDGNGAFNPVLTMSLNPPPPSIMNSQSHFTPTVNTSLYGSPHNTHPNSPYTNPTNSSPLKLKAMDEVFNQTFNPGTINMPSPAGSGGGAHVKLEETSPYSVHNTSPYSSSGGVYRDSDVERSPVPSDSASPYAYTNHSDASSLFNGGVSNLSPGMNSQISNDNQVFESYDHISESGSGGVMSPSTYPSYTTMLQVPTSTNGLMVNDLTDGGGGGGGGGSGVWNGGNMQSSSPHYSPEPNFQTPTNSLAVDMSQSQSVVSPPVMVPPPAMQQPQQQVFLEVKPYPDKSPLEGGGQLALIFGGQLPCGPKWLSFNSQQRPEYIHQVEALEENFMALSTIIPKHDIPETLTLQVICSGQIVAQTDFTYYANAQYNSDQLFHYLVHNFPDYFPEMGGARDGSGLGPGGLGGGGGGGDGYSSGGYYGDIPSTSYNLLLGSCRLGIEELVSATLQLPSMIPINTEQLRKAQQLCEEHNHSKLAEVMQIFVSLSEITPRGGENEEGVVKTKEGYEVLSKLDSSLTAEDGGLKIISRLVQIHKMNQRFKLEEEREQQVVPASPTVLPASPVPSPTDDNAADMRDTAEATENSSQRRRSSRLQRQEKSVREDEEHITPPSGHTYSRVSIAEKDDHLPPLQPLHPTNRRCLRKPLISTYSDAADSAVSMSFDRDGDFEQEVARRNSASLALSGLYSLNMSSIDGSALNIDIDPEAGYTFANSLQYECMYQVTDDYPPHSDATNIIFKAGDRIIQIGDNYVRDKGPDDFAELLQKEAVKGTSVRIIPRVSPPPSASVSSIGYGSMSSTASVRSLVHKPTDHQIMDTITMKVSNLLSMKGPGFKRSVTLPYCNSDKGFGFKLIGGNAVGLFISEVKGSRKEVQIGDQILEIAGKSAVQMSHFEASEIIAQNKEKLHLKVTQNTAKYHSIRDQFELESFFVRSHVDHTPSDSKDMTLTKGTLVRVVNSILFSDAWLAWSVDESTGIDMELKRIPSPAKAYQQFGKHIYQSVEGPQDVMVS